MSVSSEFLEIVRTKALPFNVREAEILLQSLDKNPPAVAPILTRLTKEGKLIRHRRGLYSPTSLILDNKKKRRIPTSTIFQQVSAAISYPHYFSHFTAWAMNQMTEQVISGRVLHVSLKVKEPPFPIWKKMAGGGELSKVVVHFNYLSPKEFFGYRQAWVSTADNPIFSDKERTILDSLKHPDWSGGIGNILDYLEGKPKLDFDRLIEYAIRLEDHGIIRRLGAILEAFRLVPKAGLRKLEFPKLNSYIRLDTNAQRRGKFNRRWQVIDNIKLFANSSKSD